jgi:transposase InsO family protein
MKTSCRGVELSKNRLHDQEVFVSHANAALTPIARLKLGKLVVERGFSVSQAADYYRVSWPTAARWADRYRELLAAEIGSVTATMMGDRSSRPAHSPTRTTQPVIRKIVHLRWRKLMGPVQIAGTLGMPASTVYAVLRRCRINRLSHIDRRTGEPIRRYERDHAGSLVHVDVKKLGNIPDGGGWRYVGKKQGTRNKVGTPGMNRGKHYHPNTGHAFVHSVLDDHSRVVYSEVHDDERKETAVAVLRRAVFWFAARGVVIEEVISDNGSCYRSNTWRELCRDLDIKHRRTRPYRPQTNGKIERFHRTLADGWAYARLYASESARRNALRAWIHHYNHHRPHTATGNHPPISRLTNLSGQYT